MGSNVKLSNVIGAPFSDYVMLQLYIRATRNSTVNRTNDDVLFLANKTAWARLVSSVNVQIIENEGAQDYTSYYNQFNINNSSLDYSDTDSLAKNWILEAGTSIRKGNGITLRGGIGPDGAYGLGGTEELGYRPMPGLTSVQVETTGRLGSLKQATVNFKVWNMNQLNVIEALYFRLGYSMLLEWGHTQYFDNTGDAGVFRSKDIYGIDDPFAGNQRKEKIQQAIALKARNSFGNYDGMLGIVSNFNWSMNQDGGFDCSVKIIGLGAVMDSMRINQAYKLPTGLAQEFKKNQEALRRQIQAELYLKAKAAIEADLAAKGAADTTKGLAYPTLPFKTLWEMFTKGEFPWGGLTGDKNAAWGPYSNANAILMADNIQSFYNPYIGDNAGIPADRISLYAPFANPPDGSADFVRANLRGVYYNLNGFPRVVKDSRVTLRWDLINRVSTRAYVSNLVLGNSVYDAPIEDANINADKKVVIGGNLSGTVVTRPYGKYDITKFYDLGARYVYVYAEKGGSFERLIPLSEYPQNGLTVEGSYGPATPVIKKLIAVGNNGKSEGIPFDVNFRLQSTILEGGANPSFRDNVTRKTVIDAFDAFLDKDPHSQLWTVDSVSKDSITVSIITDGPIGSLNASITDTALREATKKGNVDDGNGVPVGDNSQRIIKVKWTFTTNNPGFFYDVLPPASTEKKEEVKKEVKESDFEAAANEAVVDQVNSAAGVTSALQAMLTVVQLKAKVALGQQQKKFLVLPIIEETKKLFADGVLNGIFDSGKIPTDLPLDKLSKSSFNLLQYASKGFNSDLMVDPTLYNDVKSVNLADLCKVVAIAYKQGDDEGFGVNQFAPTYIPLGYLLAFLNSMCLIYDSPDSKIPTNNDTDQGNPKRPYIYIDFNPETNFCLTTPQQFSIDPLTCMVPLQATDAQYESLFPEDIAKALKKEIFLPKGELNQITLLLNKANLNFQAVDNSNQGKLMNILLNIDYLLNLIKGSAASDPEHAVKLQPFLNQIVVDVNKALGNINSLRVAYRDESNVVQIVDDQWVPGLSKQPSVLSGPEYNSRLQKQDEAKLAGLLPISGAPRELPVAGNLSLARQFQLKTVMSTKLASMIAISAQAATGSVNAKDHSSLSYLNAHFQDRYKPYIKDATNGNAGASGDGKAKSQEEDNDFKAAKMFNTHVINIYNDLNITPDYINLAKNYYIELMSKVKSEDENIYAAPFIPAEVEMTLDGISGIIMGNAFTIPQDRLPLSLRGENGLAKIAFIVTGLSHTIQNNEWLTKIKGQMIKLRENNKIFKSTTIIGNIKDQAEKALISRGGYGGYNYPGACPPVYDKNGKRIDGYSGAKQVLDPASVNRDNFATTYYPGYTFNKGTSDIDLGKKSIAVLTQDEIINDTSKNRFNIGKINSPVPYFVIHHTAGREKAATDVYTTFYCRGLPAQYVIDRDGKIHQFMPDGALGWHAAGYNSKAMGVEVVAKNNDDVTDAQVIAAARLIQYLGFRKDQLLGHGEISDNKEATEGQKIKQYILNNL